MNKIVKKFIDSAYKLHTINNQKDKNCAESCGETVSRSSISLSQGMRAKRRKCVVTITQSRIPCMKLSASGKFESQIFSGT